MMHPISKDSSRAHGQWAQWLKDRDIHPIAIQSCILTWIVVMIPMILLIPPGQLDQVQCSFLNASTQSNARFHKISLTSSTDNWLTSHGRRLE